ncbi:DUF916 domain-containing protein [Lactobacillus sp. S2-2]|uniref:WxL protein peptidoglycan domain-containing protein n=1 Tax=Lactobacillus sp. S2-2 TaxID=2692917 RepID=UPI001F3680AF|nr:DUF916 domain-containing protein [Lactobacillus sp. S2-2]
MPILSKKIVNKGFFQYDVLPFQKKKIEVKLKNYTNHKIKINTFINDSHNSNGIINYNYSKINDNYKRSNPSLKSMIVGRSNIVTTLKPHEIKNVSFVIKIPESGVSGVILGGINSENYGAKNKTMFSTSIVLKNNLKADNKSLDNFFINGLKTNNKRVKFNLVNNQSFILSNSNLKVELFDSSQKRIIHQQENYSMVPNSFSNYVLNNINLKPGMYKLLVTIYNKNNYKQIKKTFTIGDFKKQSYTKVNHFLIIILVIIITILYFLSVSFVKRKYKL